VRARNRALRRALPWLAPLVSVAVYTESELAEAAAAPTFTYGLDRSPPRAAYFGPEATRDECGLRERPGVYGPTEGWQRVSGPPRPLPRPRRDAQDIRASAWLELQFLWAHAFGACADPERAEAPYLSVKLVADSARLLLWLESRERVAGRADALRRALEALPEEQDALRAALALQRALPTQPAPGFEESLPALVSASERVAGHLEAAANAAGSRTVRLVWGGPAELVLGSDEEEARRRELLPLVDWRARTVVPRTPDEVFLLRRGDPGDPAILGAAAQEGRDGPYPALRAGRLLVLPTTDHWGRAILRSVQCAQTDPVSFALARGRDGAEFPELEGWSARDCARRAVAEQAGWLTDGPGEGAGTPRELAMLFGAARAALFHDSLDTGDPRLALTGRAVLGALEAAVPGERALLGEAEEALRAARISQEPAPRDLVEALRRVVVSLQPYRLAR
jgi:hypothetical protein